MEKLRRLKNLLIKLLLCQLEQLDVKEDISLKEK